MSNTLLALRHLCIATSRPLPELKIQFQQQHLQVLILDDGVSESIVNQQPAIGAPETSAVEIRVAVYLHRHGFPDTVDSLFIHRHELDTQDFTLNFDDNFIDSERCHMLVRRLALYCSEDTVHWIYNRALAALESDSAFLKIIVGESSDDSVSWTLFSLQRREGRISGQSIRTGAENVRKELYVNKALIPE